MALLRGMSGLSTRQRAPAASRTQVAVPLPVRAPLLLRRSRLALPAPAVQAPQHTAGQEATNMFCYQCESTLHGTGCTDVNHGVCGKTADCANLQDLLTFQLKGLSAWAHFAHTQGLETPEADSFVKAALFSTLTNVNFDNEAFKEYCTRADELTASVKAQLAAAGIAGGPVAHPLPWFEAGLHPITFSLRAALGTSTPDLPALENLGARVSHLRRRELMGPSALTLLGLHELVTTGLRGVAAYAHHAEMLGQVDPAIDDVCEDTLAFLASPDSADPSKVLAASMRLGEANLKTMALLEGGHVQRFGDPQPTRVRTTPVKGKAILISGHDMQDLKDLLEQTEGTGINVYTHGEMLPGHGYPGLNKYKHLVGNYGGAWYKQRCEFAEFPGSILMTTNCILPPASSYADRIFTTGEVGVAGGTHLRSKDFSAVIAKAQEMPGFTYEPEEPAFVTTGFGRAATLGAAGLVIDAIKAGDLSHIFLVGGCDAAEPSRKYYGEVVKTAPKDTVVLTLGCGKYRFIDQGDAMGTLPNGLPRLIDMGQCNDAYGALVVATELAKALGTEVNSLPLSLDISWFEQKAVAVLLTLLHLGIKGIRIGPALPAFLTPEAVSLLVENFDLQLADTAHPADDVTRMMGGAVARGR